MARKHRIDDQVRWDFYFTSRFILTVLVRFVLYALLIGGFAAI